MADKQKAQNDKPLPVQPVTDDNEQEISMPEVTSETKVAPKIVFNLNLTKSLAQKKVENKSSNTKDETIVEGGIFNDIKSELESKQPNKREVKALNKPKSNLDMVSRIPALSNFSLQLLTMVNKKEQDPKFRARDQHKRQKMSDEDEVDQDTKEDSKDEPWLFKGVVVKIMQKSLGGGKFYKNKGKVYKVTPPNGNNQDSN